MVDINQVINNAIPQMDTIRSVFFQFISYFSFISVVITIILFFYLASKYRYKIRYSDLRGVYENHDELPKDISLKSKLSRDYAREIKERGIRKWKLLFSRAVITPVEMKYISPKNIIYMIRTEKSIYLPCIFQREFQKGNHIIEKFLPMEFDIKFWEQNEIQQSGLEYKDNSFEMKKLYFFVGVIILCLIFAGVTIYFTLSYSSTVLDKINSVSASVAELAKSINPTLTQAPG